MEVPKIPPDGAFAAENREDDDDDDDDGAPREAPNKPTEPWLFRPNTLAEPVGGLEVESFAAPATRVPLSTPADRFASLPPDANVGALVVVGVASGTVLLQEVVSVSAAAEDDELAF